MLLLSNLNLGLCYLLLPFLLAISHWCLTQLYTYYCVPSGLSGIVRSFLSTSSPFCSTNLVLMTKTSELYAQIWSLIGFWSVGLLVSVYQRMSSNYTDNNTNSLKKEVK